LIEFETNLCSACCFEGISPGLRWCDPPTSTSLFSTSLSSLTVSSTISVLVDSASAMLFLFSSVSSWTRKGVKDNEVIVYIEWWCTLIL